MLRLVCFCLAIGLLMADFVHAEDALASLYDKDDDTVINKPNILPDALPRFSNEIFREKAWKPYKEPPKGEKLKEKLGVVHCSVNFILGGAKLEENFMFASAVTLTQGSLSVDLPKSGRDTTKPDRPVIEYRLDFGPPEGKGPRVEVLFAESDGGNSYDSIRGTGDTPDTTEFTSQSKGTRRRTRLALSWPLPAQKLDNKISEMRVFVGWQQFQDKNIRSNRSDAIEPGNWAWDGVEADGLTFGVRGGWPLKRDTHLFFETGFTTFNMQGKRDFRSPQTGFRYDGDGWGWDAELGIKIHRGPMTYRVAATGYSQEQTGGNGVFRFFNNLEPFDVPSTTMDGYGLSLGACYRF